MGKYFPVGLMIGLRMIQGRWTSARKPCVSPHEVLMRSGSPIAIWFCSNPASATVAMWWIIYPCK
jgi:hypothetical protein